MLQINEMLHVHGEKYLNIMVSTRHINIRHHIKLTILLIEITWIFKTVLFHFGSNSLQSIVSIIELSFT